ncbi:ASCH domain-containing protein [Caloranaerobacter ferrireducens]|uniref:ASCH domain-containing protein n=1 Tax=Caloranaerobacter ferrireducens TaxID=1323370 RepID=UPI00084D45A1|nr:ASCH domain-containing protein [Caloranaerobacter ferrireducens]
MEHFMRLFEEPFELIRSKKKIIEIRLNDEKRQKVKIGDIITFSKLPDCEERLRVKVLGLLHYYTFEQLYEDIPFSHFGCEGKSMKWMLEKTYEIYTKEQEEKYGALGIRIEVIE